jgi:hypothetical protein
MNLPLSERALRAIECRLRKIRKQGGFHTDAGRNVVREVESASSDDLPWISVFEVGEQPANGAGNLAAWAMALSIEIQAGLSPDCAGTDRQLLKADIKRAVFRQFGGALADDLGQIGALSYRGATSVNKQDGGDAELLRISITVTYAEGNGNPYGSEDASHAPHRIDRLF